MTCNEIIDEQLAIDRLVHNYVIQAGLYWACMPMSKISCMYTVYVCKLLVGWVSSPVDYLKVTAIYIKTSPFKFQMRY